MLNMVLQTQVNVRSITMNRIRPVNPVARAVALSRRRASIVPPKKGNKSYNRKKLKDPIKNYIDVQDNNK